MKMRGVMLTSSDIIGTTLILIASDAFSRYEHATGGVLDNTTGLLTITSHQYNNLKSLFFKIGGVRILLSLFFGMALLNVFLPFRLDHFRVDCRCSNLAS